MNEWIFGRFPISEFGSKLSRLDICFYDTNYVRSKQQRSGYESGMPLKIVPKFEL